MQFRPNFFSVNLKARDKPFSEKGGNITVPNSNSLFNALFNAYYKNNYPLTYNLLNALGLTYYTVAY